SGAEDTAAMAGAVPILVPDGDIARSIAPTDTGGEDTVWVTETTAGVTADTAWATPAMASARTGVGYPATAGAIQGSMARRSPSGAPWAASPSARTLTDRRPTEFDVHKETIRPGSWVDCGPDPGRPFAPRLRPQHGNRAGTGAYRHLDRTSRPSGSSKSSERLRESHPAIGP